MTKIFQMIKAQEPQDVSDAFLALFIGCCGASIMIAWFGFLAIHDYLIF